MNHIIEKHEQYALIGIQEDTIDADGAADLEDIARGLLREDFKNLILDFSFTRAIESTGIAVLKKLNVLCARELGLMVIVSDNDDFIEAHIEGKIRDATILPTTEEAIDAVFMNDLENEFGAEGNDFDDDDYESPEPSSNESY
jgi:anti-anti-sigma regulatory factor